MTFEEADAINQAVRRLTINGRARAGELLAAIGLHPGQEVLLLELARRGPMIHSQLSKAMGCEPPSITLMAAKLEAAGYVTRRPAPSDRRVSIIELSDSGTSIVEDVRRLWRQLAEETVGELPAAALPSLSTTLCQLGRNLEAARRRQAAVEPCE